MESNSGFFIDESNFLKDALKNFTDNDSYEYVQNAFETAKEYWEYSKSTAVGRENFIKEFLYIFNYYLQQINENNFDLISQNYREKPICVLHILPDEPKLELKTQQNDLDIINIVLDANFRKIFWGIIYQDFQLRIFGPSVKQIRNHWEVENNFLWANLDEIFRHNHIDSFYNLFKVLRMIEKSGNKININNKTANYLDRTDFRSMVELCKNRGDDVIVGFMGGEKALATRDINSLEKRKFKWDNAIGCTGIKEPRNWIPGSVFTRIIDEKSSLPRQSSSLNPSSKRSPNWEGTLKFSDMYDLCLKSRDGIIVGFTGGKKEFVRMTLSELQNRSSYKWDFSKNIAGKKQSNWLSGAKVVEMLKDYFGFTGNLD